MSNDFVQLSLAPILIGIFASIACALLGNFLVLRRQSLIGDAVAHVALPGIVVAFIVTGTISAWPMLIGAAIAAIVAVLLIELIRKVGNVEPGAAMGVVFTALFAAGVLLLEQTDTSSVHLDVEHALYGNLESMIWLAGRDWSALFDPVALTRLPEQLPRLAIVALAVIAFWKELVIGTFDAAFARSIGARPTFTSFALIVMVAVAAVAAVGSIIIFATLSAIIGYVFAGYGPLWFGSPYSVSAAGMIATVSGVILGLAALFGPRRFGAKVPGGRKARGKQTAPAARPKPQV